MKTKRILSGCAAAVVLTVLFLTLSGCHRPIKHLVYTDDYPSKYEKELHQIFGDYLLGERTDRHIQGEDCSCGYHQDTVDCYEWTVTYTDALGQTMRCTMNNRQSLYEQQVEWLRNQIEEHFNSTYVSSTFDGLTLDNRSRCVCTVGRVCSGFRGGDREEEANVETATAYLEALRQKEQLIPLSSLRYSELFDRYPILMDIQVCLSSQDTQQNTNARAKGLQKVMTGQMAEEIGTNLNLEASVEIDASDRKTVYYLNGAESVFLDGFDFQHAVFRSYKGKFW